MKVFFLNIHIYCGWRELLSTEQTVSSHLLCADSPPHDEYICSIVHSIWSLLLTELTDCTLKVKTYAMLPCIDRCAVHTYTLHTVAASVLSVLNVYLSVCIATYAKHKTPVYLMVHVVILTTIKFPF